MKAIAHITREQLATLLEEEAFPTAADQIRRGENPRHVLGELRPFVPRYNDSISRASVQTFQEICRGEVQVDS